MSLILGLRKNNTRANKILALIIVLPAGAFFTNLLVYLDQIGTMFILVYFNVAISLLFGPSLLYYFNLMLGRKVVFQNKQVLHLVPSLVVGIIGLSLISLNTQERDALLDRIRAGTDDMSNILSLVLLIHILSYLFMSWKMQQQHFKDVTSFYTDLEHTKYRWVKLFISSLIGINVLFILCYLLPALFAPHLMMYTDLMVTPFLTFLIYLFIMITGFNNQAVFSDTEYTAYANGLVPFNAYVKETEEGKKYGNAALKEEVLTDIEERLQKILKEQKPYLDKELSINKLSESIGISSHQLSQFINRTYEKNFYDFVNFYRVEETKSLLIDPSNGHFKIEAIGEAAGFNSRATFFSVFKKVTGMTPSAFRKNINN